MSKLWGGRFDKETSELVERFNASIGFDVNLWEYDIRGSIAHARMLGKCGIIPQSDAEMIVEGLTALADDIRAGKVSFDISAEDVHMNIEKLLHERIGEVAGKLHTARSRNDQVALDLRMYVKDRIKDIQEAILELQDTLVNLAEKHADVVVPGYTHLQHAQPVTLAHHLLAYFWMLERDRDRLSDCYKRTDVMPLGSGAIAGTSFPIDRHYVAELLGFSQITENSMDAVSDRDFVAELLSIVAILGMHLSRFAEEIIIWNTREFAFIELDDSVATGSSLMPQKKNPDVAELIRGKTGRLYGNLLAILTVMKGIPLTYNKDMQEDKEPLFDSVNTILVSLRVLRILLESTDFQVDRMAAMTRGDFSTATDLADYLVRQGMPFRIAHEIVGKIVGYCVKSGRSLEQLSLEELRSFSDRFTDDNIVSEPAQSVEARNVPGGTSRNQLNDQIKKARQAIAKSVS